MLRSLALGVLLALMNVASAQTCTLVMGYRTTARLPNIAAAPDHSGLYLDLYREASRRIGCQLNVVREPKNRILAALKSGKIDFYPGLVFSAARAKDLYFVPNGLPSQQVALTRSSVPLMNSLASMRGKTLLMAMGGAYKETAQQGLSVRNPPELTIEKAVEFIAAGKGDIYIDELSSLIYYLNRYPDKHKLMLHPNCCGGAQYFTMGLSRQSQHASYLANPNFNPQGPIDAGNDPQMLAPNCKLARFSQALQQLSKDGFTSKLYKQYYGIDMPKIPDHR